MTIDLLTAPAAYDLAPGFEDPVADSQAVFRATMEAMARPGTHGVVRVELVPPAPLGPAMAAVALSLLDYETRFWIPETASDARGWIRFHTGARAAREAEEADFVLVPAMYSPPNLDSLRLGTDEEPESSATVLVEVTSFGAGTRLVLSGPGVDGKNRLEVEGLDSGLLAARRALSTMFPRGVDLILTAGRTIAAIPRTTRLEG
jgi:alpha-D-ribose 1-methylphosphonate 5-triphosphate synthase subunit PhnH